MDTPHGGTTHAGQSGIVDVALLGVAPIAIPEAPRAPIALPANPGRDDLGPIVEVLRSGERELVIILPEPLVEPGRQRVQTVASALGGRPVAFHVTALSGLGAATLGALAAAAAPHVASAGILAAALPALERELTGVAVLRGVSRLNAAKPTLAQRLQALLPGRLFVARGGEEATVARADGRAPGDDLARLLPGASASVLAARGRGTQHGETAARAIVGATGAAPLQGEGDGGIPGPWGRAPLLEAVAWPADQAAMLQRVFGRPFAPCPWCERPAAATPCPTCGHDRNPALVAAVAS